MGLPSAAEHFASLLGPANPEYAELIVQANADFAAQQASPAAFGVPYHYDAVGYVWEYRVGVAGGRAAAASLVLPQLEGQRVVDLGSGPVLGRFQRLLGAHPPQYYIGVDHGSDFSRRPSSFADVGQYTLLSRGQGGDPLDGALVKADMLDVLSRLPPEFGSAVLNGIDEQIIDHKGEYGRAVIHEIGRVTKVGGMVLGAAFAKGMLQTLPYRMALEPVPEIAAMSASRMAGVFHAYTKVA